MGSAHGRLRSAAWKGISTGRSTACVKLRLPLTSSGRHYPTPHRHQKDFAIVQCAILQCAIMQYAIMQYAIMQYAIMQYMDRFCPGYISEAMQRLACVH